MLSSYLGIAVFAGMIYLLGNYEDTLALIERVRDWKQEALPTSVDFIKQHLCLLSLILLNLTGALISTANLFTGWFWTEGGAGVFCFGCWFMFVPSILAFLIEFGIIVPQEQERVTGWHDW